MFLVILLMITSLMDRFEFGFIPTGQNAYGERTSGIVYGDGGSQVDFPGTPGNTFGMIKDQNGVPQLVRAYPVRFGDKRLSKDVVKIQKAIKTEFANLCCIAIDESIIVNLDSNKTQDSFIS